MCTSMIVILFWASAMELECSRQHPLLCLGLYKENTCGALLKSVQLSRSVSTDKCIDVHRTLVIEATLHYCKWDVRQVHCWPPPQTETDTGKWNSIFIVLPRFKERKCLNPLLSIAVWGCIEKTTQSWGNGSVGKVLASKCEDPSCTKSPIKTNHDGRPGDGRAQVLHGRVVSHLISFLQLNSSLGSMIFPNQQSLLVLQVEVSNWFLKDRRS